MTFYCSLMTCPSIIWWWFLFLFQSVESRLNWTIGWTIIQLGLTSHAWFTELAHSALWSFTNLNYFPILFYFSLWETTPSVRALLSKDWCIQCLEKLRCKTRTRGCRRFEIMEGAIAWLQLRKINFGYAKLGSTDRKNATDFL